VGRGGLTTNLAKIVSRNCWKLIVARTPKAAASRIGAVCGIFRIDGAAGGINDKVKTAGRRILLTSAPKVI
jgi:hypothetical protein